MKSDEVLLLCGEYSGALHEFQAIVCLNPIRRIVLAQQNIASLRFSDFAPGEELGQTFDAALYRDLDHCLHTEAQTHSDSRWAPAAYLLIVYRLSRYLWVKHCVRNLVHRLHPRTIRVSSGADRDLTQACRTIAAEHRVSVLVESENLDATSAHVYLVRTYGLPRSLDPQPLLALRWHLTAAIAGKRRNILVQSYGNLDLEDGRIFWFSFVRALNISGRLLEKICELFGQRSSTELLDRPIDLDNAALRFARCAAWRQHFADDEIQLVDRLLRAFNDDYPAGFLDQIEQALIKMLRSLGIKRVVTMHDRLDASRLLTRAAHQAGIPVDYLVHGLTFEDFAGPSIPSPFIPDRILAWSESSAQVFGQLGWQSATVAHPQFRPAPRSLTPLSGRWGTARVLVLVSDWVVASQASSEDCAIVELIEVCEGLGQLGVDSRNIHVKIHSGTKASLTTKASQIEWLRQASSLEFAIVDPFLRTTELMPQFDLVIFGITSALFEAVMLGVPGVLFGMSQARVGALRPFSFPAAANAAELVKVLERFDNQAVAQLYGDIAASLRFGSALPDVAATA